MLSGGLRVHGICATSFPKLPKHWCELKMLTSKLCIKKGVCTSNQILMFGKQLTKLITIVTCFQKCRQVIRKI